MIRKIRLHQGLSARYGETAAGFPVKLAILFNFPQDGANRFALADPFKGCRCTSVTTGTTQVTLGPVDLDFRIRVYKDRVRFTAGNALPAADAPVFDLENFRMRLLVFRIAAPPAPQGTAF